MKLPLSHYARAPVGPLKSVDQWLYGAHKPQGLWVTVDGPDDWPSYVQSIAGGHATRGLVATLKHRYVVVMRPEARILTLNSRKAIRDFARSYGDTPRIFDWTEKVRWNRVAREYQGILIPKCFGSEVWAEPTGHWYHGWDCASGCIWDPQAIASITLTEEHAA